MNDWLHIPVARQYELVNKKCAFRLDDGTTLHLVQGTLHIIAQQEMNLCKIKVDLDVSQIPRGTNWDFYLTQAEADQIVSNGSRPLDCPYVCTLDIVRNEFK